MTDRAAARTILAPAKTIVARAPAALLPFRFRFQTLAARTTYRTSSLRRGGPVASLIPKGALGMHALIWVPTDSIRACIASSTEPWRRVDSGSFFDMFCKPGSWDRSTIPLAEVIDRSHIYAMLARTCRAWPSRAPSRDVGPAESRKLRKFEQLLRSIDRHGFSACGPLKCAHGCIYPDEIVVAVGRDGSMLKALEGGNRRLIAARARGVTEVPVWVRGVHIEGRAGVG